MENKEYTKVMTKYIAAKCLMCNYPTQPPSEYQRAVCRGLIALCNNCHGVVFEDGWVGHLKKEIKKKVFFPVRN